MGEAIIEFTRHQNENGEKYITYKWIGKKTDYVIFATNELARLQAGGVIISAFPGGVIVGPYRLRKIKGDSLLGEWFMLDGPRAILYSVWFRLREYKKLIYGRIMLTLWVWNMVNAKPGKIMSWRDVKIIRRFIK